MPANEIARLSFETAQRALEIQERAVDQLRSRTSALLTASSLIASFFGGEAIKRGSGLGPVGVLGLVAMAVSIGLCVYVLIPKQSFAFNLNARETYERLRDAPSDTAVHERLLAWLAECTDVNEAGIAILSRIYLAATICLMLQLASWAIAFLGTVY